MSQEPYRIMIVEDNPGDVRLIRETLRALNISYELIHYAAADTAISAIGRCGENGSTTPDLILIDYNVPRGDGRDMLCAVSKNPALAEVPRAIVTSSMADEDREQSLRLGAACYIIKPAALNDFLSQVGAAITELLKLQPLAATPSAGQ